MLEIKKNKIRISKFLLLFIFTVFPTIFYCSSRMSFGDRIPVKLYMFICSVGLIFFVLYSLKKNVKYTLVDFIAIFIILIVCIWNNWDLKNGTVYPIFLFTLLFGMFIFASKTDFWTIYAFKLIIIFSIFYAFWTIISWLSPSIYYRVVLPLVKDSSIYDLARQYSRGHMAGLTAHYSTNGIYLSSGICFTLGYYFFCGDTFKNIKMKGWICIIFQIFNLFLTGKRGPVIYLMLAFVLGYIVYNINEPITRYLKIIGIFSVIIVIYLVMTLWFPTLLTFVNRFNDVISAGDISNGRYVLWSQAYLAFLEKPMMGNGWYWFKYNNLRGEAYYHVHNCYLQWLCELGIIGAIPFFLFIFVMFYKSFMLLKLWRRGKLNVTDTEKKLISIPFIYNAYFICACFTGTHFFEGQSLCPYILCSAYTQWLWRKYILKIQ